MSLLSYITGQSNKSDSVNETELLKQSNLTEGEYTLEVTVNQKTYTLQTDDMVEAFLSMQPEKVTSKVTVKAVKGKRSIVKTIFNCQTAKRLFNNRTYAGYFVKNLKLVLQ